MFIMPKTSGKKTVSQRKLNFDDVPSIDKNESSISGNKDALSSKKRSIPSTYSMQSTKRTKRNQQSIENFVSPQKKTNVTVESSLQSNANIVTPPTYVVSSTKEKLLLSSSQLDETIDDEKNEYIPSYIHKNVDYISKDVLLSSSTTTKNVLSLRESKLIEFITKYYHIPKDFESNRKYGPLSGTTYVNRVITAYRLKSLQQRTDILVVPVICTACAEIGHSADECPTTI